MMKTVGLALTAELHTDLPELAAFRQITASALARQILTEYFEAHPGELGLAREAAEMQRKIIRSCRAKLKGV